MTDTVCPMFGDVCGYHSKVYMTRPYTQIWKNPKTKMFEPAGLGRSIVDIDDFCNNHPIGSSGRISEMHYCPKRWALYRGAVKVEKAKKRKYVRKEVKNKMESKKNTQHKPDNRDSARRPAKVAKGVTKPRRKKLLKKKV